MKNFPTAWTAQELLDYFKSLKVDVTKIESCLPYLSTVKQIGRDPSQEALKINTAVLTFKKANDAYIFKNQLDGHVIKNGDQSFNFFIDFVLNSSQREARDEFKMLKTTLCLRNVPELMTEGDELKRFLESFGAQVKRVDI